MTNDLPGRRVDFDSAVLAVLPEPAHRWLTHAVRPGSRMAGVGEFEMHGEVKLGRWRPFHAHQELVPRSSFVWAAHTRLFGLPVTGADRFADGEGMMRWRVLSPVPIMTARGADVTRSAAGRLVGEAVLVPSGLVDAFWRTGPDADSAVYRQQVGSFSTDVQIRVDKIGALRSVTLERWGNPDGRGYRDCAFTVTSDAELTRDGLTIMSSYRAAWGTDLDAGEFFRAHIHQARFR